MKEHTWVTIDVGGELIDVSQDAVKVDGVRQIYTYNEALAEAKALGGELCTPEVLDARWEAADLKNPPHTQRLRQGENDPALHSRLIDQDVSAFRALHGRCPHIVGNAGKPWVHTPYAKAAPLYGWYFSPGMPTRGIPTHQAATLRTSSRIIQKAETDDSTFHNRNYKDYSSFLVLMRRYGDRSERPTQPPSLPDHDTEPHTPILTVALPPIKFVQAKNYTKAGRGVVDLIVIHTAEIIEAYDSAERLAQWASGPQAPRASWHYAIDNNTIVQCVHDSDIAWAAPGANHNGIQIELCGFARQTPAQWADPYSIAQRDLATLLIAHLCDRWNIPARKLTLAELKAGKRGLIGHVDATLAFKKSTHVDPGPAFPWQKYEELVQMNLALL